MDNTKPTNLLGRNKAILFILLDAFRWDYLTPEDSPTLFEMSKSSIYARKLVTSSGFAQRSTISTGALPDTHGNYAMYTYDPVTSPYKALQFFSGVLRALPKSGYFYRLIRKIINQIPKLTDSYAPPGRIPSEILHLISVKEDLRPIYKSGSMSVESIYDKLQEAAIPYKYYMAPVSYNDEVTLKQMLADMDKGHQVLFVQFSDTDSGVHESGTAGEERRRIVRYTDDRIRKLKEKFEQTQENPWIVIVGDHGMVDVTKYIDIWTPIESFAKSNALINGRDYLMFLDSTLARFWFFSDHARQTLAPFLHDHLKEGEFMTEEYMNSRHIPSNQQLYGELIWKANVSVGIFPDYFHWPSEKYQSMHGYDCTDNSMKGLAVLYNKLLNNQKIVEEAGLHDICPSLCDILALPYPKQNKGRSLLNSFWPT